MRILALSEHFWPRFGGTVTYVHKTCEALATQGHEVTLLVPGPRPEESAEEMLSGLTYNVCWIDADYPRAGEPSRAARYAFCQMAEKEVLDRCANPALRPDVVHVMFGLFLMEVIDTRRILPSRVMTVATVHNVPPMECARTWRGSPVKDRLLDRVRLRGVAIKNSMRLRRFPYDLYVVPSRPVAKALQDVLPAAFIKTVSHGYDEDLALMMSPPASRTPGPQGAIQILTAGGWAPHKRQAIIPGSISRLASRGIEVKWEIIGPSTRIAGYRDAVEAEARRLGIIDRLVIKDAVSRSELAAAYDRAQIYVQPSTEEGYCLTALDAAAAGLPVIGCPAGALPEICEISGGRLIKSTPEDVADAVAEFVETDAWNLDRGRGGKWIRRHLNWTQAAGDLLDAIRRTSVRSNASVSAASDV